MHPHSNNIEERDLMALLESFGSSFSLEDIASANCEANRNVDYAAEILCSSNSAELKGSSDQQNKIAEPAKGSSSTELFGKRLTGKRNSGAAVKSKPQSASLGTVSGVVGKDYIKPKTLNVPYYQEVKNKPLKIDAKELPESEIWGERNSVSAAAAAAVKGTVSDDVVNFLFTMLGDGFELDRNNIHDILGLCGYDVQQTMEKLLDMSASTLKKCDDVHGLAGDNLPEARYAASSEVALTPIDSSERDEYRVGLQNEILGTLFTYPQKSEEKPTWRPVRATPYGTVVRMPEDTPAVQQSSVVESHKEESDDDDENSYKVLRKAVKEHWITMKESYRAAIDAFTKGDYASANRLLEQGHFYNRKAREADEKSTQKVLQIKNNEDGEIPLDLSEQEPKEALHLLKLHLTSLCGIRVIKYLRVIVGTGNEVRKGTRKKLIIRQLEKNSIQWTEEDNGRALRLHVDVIDPKSLTFAQKH